MSQLPENKDLIEVIFKYKDDSEYSLNDKDLDLWKNFNSTVALCAQIHGTNPPWEDINYKQKSKKEPNY